jgi:cytochrome P450
MDAPNKRLEDFSLLDPQVQDDPFAMYEAMQAYPGIYQMPETGFFIVSRYANLRAVLTDPATFSNDVDRASLQGPELSEKHQHYLSEHGWPHIQTLQRTDAPAHSRYRKLVDRVFTVGRVREMTPHIEEVANRLIDNFADRGECEFISEFAMLLPGIILAEQMGLAPAEVATFKRWADAMLAPASRQMNEEELRTVADIELEAQHHLSRMFEDRRANPQADLISGLVHAHTESEEPLSMAELQSVMSQLIGGGFESTMTAIGHAMLQLIRHPEQMQELRDNPPLIKGFVEEVIRIESPTQGLRRRATRDVELSGTLIPEGSVVVVRYGAANRDPAKFVCPHQFDMKRSNAGTHLAFGAGAHFCVGAVLARQEIATGILTILSRLDDIALARPLTEPIHRPNFLTLPLRELPIRFKAKA